MNLRLAYKLIAKAEHQPRGILKVRGREEAREVHLMAEAGLVNESKLDNADPSEAMITRITHAGPPILSRFAQRAQFFERLARVNCPPSPRLRRTVSLRKNGGKGIDSHPSESESL